MTDTPQRGFPIAEFATRTSRMQATMAEHRLDCILLTTEANVSYFSGFSTQFWTSPTRPWFLIIPAQGKPIAVIPEIGVAGMAATWIEDIRTWPSPRPADDGISLLTECINSLPAEHGNFGACLGAESHLRMPVADYHRLINGLTHLQPIDVASLLHQQRMIKSELEIDKIRAVCELASASFKALPELIHTGMSEREICRQMRLDLIRRGADSVPYLVAGSGPDGYDSIIMGPNDHCTTAGDLMIIDTGTRRDGYFCDFDRNFAFNRINQQVQQANQVVHETVDAGFAAAKPGATTSDIWQAMNQRLVAGGSLGNDVGRLGHGLGLQLTEQPSITATDNTTLEPGMVLTLEPGMIFAPGKQIVHEENIVITESGASWLSVRADPEIPVID